MISYSANPGLLIDWLPPDFSGVLEGLDRVQKKLWEIVESDSPIVRQTSRHLIDANGKLFRPLLTLSAATLGAHESPQVFDAAVLCELTHLASLHHDDVIDEDTTRRGVPTVNARWGNSVAILTGDYLLAVAAQVCVSLGREAQELHAATARRLVTGQIAEVIGPAPGSNALEHYMSVIRDKTAALIALSARLGALLAGAREESELLAVYGERLGVAFQLANDLCDLMPSRNGRKAGTDLRRRLETLPVLYARAYARPCDSRLLELLDGDLTTEESMNSAIVLLRSHPGFAVAQADVLRQIKQCVEALAPLPASMAKSGLLALTKVLCLPGMQVARPSRSSSEA